MSASLTRAVDSDEAADRADKALKEFDKRWEWYEGGYGTFWKERVKKS